MKKMAVWLLMIFLIAAAACGALAQGMTVVCEYDDGTTAPITDGCTVKTDGEILIRFDGLTDGLPYRTTFTGKARSGEVFNDYQGFVSGEDMNYIYLTLTEKAGTYGPFELTLTGDGMQETISFSAEVTPAKEKDWLRYGVLNQPAMAALPPFLAVEPGDMNSPTIATKNLRIMEPADGAVLSGYSFGELYFSYEVLSPGTDVRMRMIDTTTGDVIRELGDYFPEEDRRGMILEFKDMFAFDRDYIFEVSDGTETASVSFKLIEEDGGDAQSAQQIMDAREEMNASYHAEDVHDAGGQELPQMDEDSKAILENSQTYDFAALKKCGVDSAEGRAYDMLVDAFNERIGGYATGMNMEFGIYKYCKSADEGGMLQSWALSGSHPVIAEVETNEKDSEKHLIASMQFGFQIEQVFRQMLGDAMTSQMPVNMKRIVEYNGGDKVDIQIVPVAYAKAMLDNGKCAADMLLYATKLSGREVETHRYIYVRFMDPLGDGSQVYEWNIADQALVKAFIDQIGAVEAGEQTASVAEDAAQQRFVRIRKDGNVNVRSKSNADSSRVGVAKANATYLCLGVAENGWFQIQLEDGKTGYISPKMATLIE